jgi:hypothetical protein
MALIISQIHKWGSNQRKLIGVKNLEWGAKNKKNIKAYVQNNKWKSQMLPTHPPT